jgi:uncharacterized protein (DUF488 family)
MTTVWTIGHSTRTAAEFFALLQENRIEMVADVRHFPGSRRFPQFNQARLRGSLAEGGIGYVHLPELGGRRPARPGSRNLVWRDASFRGFADHMETPEFGAGIEHLLGLARSRRTVVMCAEAVWWRCHRSLIADLLKSVGVRVLHILGPGRVEEHPYTAAARVVDGRLTYVPAPARPEPRTAPEASAMPHVKVGDPVERHSEAGRKTGYPVMPKSPALRKVPKSRKNRPSPLA